MTIAELKKALSGITTLTFRLADGTSVPSHFHVTEVGRVTKHFIDCGGTERTETVASLQLWVAGDVDHRLAAQKFLRILDLSQKILGGDDLPVEVEYQQATIGKFGLAFDGAAFILTPLQTACLAQDACGIPPHMQQAQSCCGSGGCC